MKAVDLFCGAGGFSLGLKNSGFDLIGAHDNWDPAVDTYSKNLGSHVSKVEISPELKIPKCDVIAGGPPCQGFSSAGTRISEDDRNSLVGVFSEIVAKHLPRAFIFENVEGFLTSGNGRFVFDLLSTLIEAGYFIHLRKVNAANFGVPQHRKRVIAIGGLGWAPTFPEPTHRAYGAPGANTGIPACLPPTQSLGDILNSIKRYINENYLFPLEDNDKTVFNGNDHERTKLLKPGQRMKDLPEEMWHTSYKRRAFRRVMDGMPTEKRGGAPSGIRRLSEIEPSKAITGGALRDFIHPTENRPLTIRECAVLQTFPMDFIFSGTQRDRIQLIGNAVPPRLGQVIGSHLIRDLRNLKSAISSKGRLLSFVPTMALGMSPNLSKVFKKIHAMYGIYEEKDQGELACL